MPFLWAKTWVLCGSGIFFLFYPLFNVRSVRIEPDCSNYIKVSPTTAPKFRSWGEGWGIYILTLFCLLLLSGHPWICENGVAPDRALDPAVLSRLKQFSAMNKLKKMALRVSSYSCLKQLKSNCSYPLYHTHYIRAGLYLEMYSELLYVSHLFRNGSI